MRNVRDLCVMLLTVTCNEESLDRIKIENSYEGQ